MGCGPAAKPAAPALDRPADARDRRCAGARQGSGWTLERVLAPDAAPEDCALLQPYGWLHRHPGTQPREVLTGVELDPHRQALHHLDVVAGRVFRRQQAVEGAGGAGHARDVTVKVASQRVE